MLSTFPLSTPVAEQLPNFEDHSCSSVTTSTAHNFLRTQPQHHTTVQFKTEQGMSNGKRRLVSSLTDSNLDNSAATFAEEKLSGSTLNSKPKHSSNKKRCVSFCKTTKAPSQVKDQCPPLNTIDKIILPNDMMNQSARCKSLPQLSESSPLTGEASTVELDLNVSPATFVNTLLLQSKSITGSICGEDIISDASQRVKHDSYYLSYTGGHLEAYTTATVNAVQGNDVTTLRSLHEAGHEMQASNRFGESILHTACRRGFTDTVQFFLNEARVSPRVRDDMGRTPMHDVCWSSAAPNHDIMKMLIYAAPEMLLSKDKRGHSPFDYARREHWPNWIKFLNDHRQIIVCSLVSSYLENLKHTIVKDDIISSDGIRRGTM